MRLLLALALLTGCPSEPPGSEIYLGRLTGAPPTLVAEVDNPFEGTPSIDISSGAGIGISCAEHCAGRLASSGDCLSPRFEIEPAGLAATHPVSLPGRDGVLVLIAGEPGAGTLTVTGACAEKTYELRVLP